MSAGRDALPIDVVLDDVVASVSSVGSAVLVAPPGAGKTTRVPPALANAGLGPVVVLEPRRIAARAAARRVAAETGCEVGARVGYQVRFDKQVSKTTEITFCTEGILLARLQDDPFLDGVGCVMFDEFHERSLDADLALAMTRRIASDARADLRIVVTSATLDPQPASRFLGDAPIVESEGRSHPVEISFLPREGGGRERFEDHVARGVVAALEGGDGDVLVFLPGVGEIKRCAKRLGAALSGAHPEVRIHELFGDLGPAEQDAALQPGARRRVVLATNVAESSVTVGGVRAVVDSGEARVLRHDPASGVDRLRIERIDRAAADQRAGRAGRLGPGRAIRLWSAIDDRALEPFLAPAVRRSDIAGPYLQLVLWGEKDPATFPWFETPRPEVLRAAAEQLQGLGALDGSGRITPFGRTIARLPLQPRLAALVQRSREFGVPGLGALAAAMMSERDPFRRGAPAGGARGGRAPVKDATTSDLFERCVALEAFERTKRRDSHVGEIAPAAARAVLRVRDQIVRQTRRGESSRADDEEEALARAVYAAFPDRLARRRETDSERAVMVGGRGVRMGPSTGVTEGELFVALEVGAGRRPGDEDVVRMASAVERAWVDGGEVRVSTEPIFDAPSGRVVGKRREMLGPLVLKESDHPLGRGPAMEAVLLEAAQDSPMEALGLSPSSASEEAKNTLARIEFLRAHVPEVEAPAPTEETFREMLPILVSGCRSFADLRDRDPLAMFLGTWSHEQRQSLDRDAPDRILVPTGSSIRLEYDGGKAPVLAVRIQELFGLAETPTVARGRVRVLLHLLGPNRRPQQVTDDLESFWREAYVRVRKDLRGRYPKHSWPENPLEAEPTRRTKRRPQ